MEEHAKIGLAKEVLWHLYKSAKDYKALAEEKDREILRLKGQIKNLEEENSRLGKDHKDVQVLLEEIKKGKAAEIEQKETLIKCYLKNITDTVDELSKKVDSISKTSCETEDMHEKIGMQLSLAVEEIKALVKEVQIPGTDQSPEEEPKGPERLKSSVHHDGQE